MKDLKRNYISRNKLPLVILVIFYAGLLYLLNYTIVDHDIRVINDEVKQKIIIEVEKK